MNDFLPDANIDDSNQEKLRAIWWRLCSTTGAGKTILRSWIPRLGANWEPIPNTHTTPEQELGALPQNFANVREQIQGLSAQVAGLKELITQLAKAQGVDGTINYAAVAKAVVDEEARRLSGGSPVLTGTPPEDTKK